VIRVNEAITAASAAHPHRGPEPPLGQRQLPVGSVREEVPDGMAAAGPAVAAAGAGAVADGGASLPRANSVLAVIARPGQESADLGMLLSYFGMRGARLAVMCLTRGEASERNSTTERLEAVRPWELRTAAGLLGVTSVTIADYPDGGLGFVPPAGLAERILRTAQRARADLLLVVDPAAFADLDTTAVAVAASIAARQAGLAVLARTVPGPGDRWWVDLASVADQVRERQSRALRAHRSQAEPGRDLPGGARDWPARQAGPGLAGSFPPLPGGGEAPEMVRWLVPPSPAAAA
jgi:LmbE family N-acetylglucosaminyl deacetylase